MNRAVNEASNEHDGAYRDSMALDLIAKNYKVDRKELEQSTMKEVKSRRELEIYYLENRGYIDD